VTYLDFISPLVSSKHQVDSIYFDFSSAFDFVPHSIFLYKLYVYGLSDSHVNWFCSYLTVRYSSVRILGVFSSHFAVSSVVSQGSVCWVLFFSVYLLMTSAMQLSPLRTYKLLMISKFSELSILPMTALCGKLTSNYKPRVPLTTWNWKSARLGLLPSAGK
jgi:hypothetical protein